MPVSPGGTPVKESNWEQTMMGRTRSQEKNDKEGMKHSRGYFRRRRGTLKLMWRDSVKEIWKRQV